MATVDAKMMWVATPFTIPVCLAVVVVGWWLWCHR